MDLNDKRNQSGGQIPRGVHEETLILGTRGDVTHPFQRALPRSAFYVQALDKVVLNVTSLINNIQFTIWARLILANGEQKDLQQVNTYAGAGGGQDFDMPLAEGWLVSVAINVNTAGVPDGACGVQVFLLRGIDLSSSGLIMLMSDCISSQWQMAWPNNIIWGPRRNIGYQRTFTGNTPAAGTFARIDFGLLLRRRIQTIACTLTTSATVGNRQVRAELGNGVVNEVSVTAGFTQAASLTVAYYWAPGLTYNSSDPLRIVAPWPRDTEASVDAGLSLFVNTVNLAAGDQFTAITIMETVWHESD